MTKGKIEALKRLKEVEGMIAGDRLVIRRMIRWLEQIQAPNLTNDGLTRDATLAALRSLLAETAQKDKQ